MLFRSLYRPLYRLTETSEVTTRLSGQATYQGTRDSDWANPEPSNLSEIQITFSWDCSNLP